jgi:F-type H+-transporting ATPase subunit delta
VRTGTQGAARGAARALLDAVEKKKDDAAAVRDGLRLAAATVRDHPELRAALSHPSLSAERRDKIVSAVFASAPEIVRGFLDILAARRAIALVGEIAASYEAQWNAGRGVVAAEAVTAVPLDPPLARTLEAKIRQTTGLTAELTEKTDPAVLGGVLLKMGGRTYDGTIRGRLDALRRTLRGETRS